MFKTLVSIVPRRRLTTVAWLVIVVGLLQLLFSFIVDEVRSKDAQVAKQDCSTTKNSGIIKILPIGYKLHIQD